MTRYNQLTQAEHMYVNDKKSLRTLKTIKKTPPLEIYSLINILKNIPLVKQYTDSLQPEQTLKQKPTGCLTPDIVR